MSTKPLTNAERTAALNATNTNLVYLVVGSSFTKACQILTDREMQAAVSASRPRVGGLVSGGQDSDPTGEAAMRGSAVELRARQIISHWYDDLRECSVMVRWVRTTAAELTDAPAPERRQPSLVRTVRDLRALSIVPRHLANTAAALLDGEELAEFDAAIRGAHDLAARVRFSVGKVPGVATVLNEATKALEAKPPAPKQKPLQGCVSCARDGGHFTPIDLRHASRSLCRVCGDYTSGEGAWPPLGAVQYLHRTGKNLTWKVIEEAKRAERAS